MIERRRFLAGLAGLVCSPAIVRASSLMAVRPWVDDGVCFLSVAHPIGDSSSNIADLRYVPDDISADALTEFTSEKLEYLVRMRWSIEKGIYRESNIWEAV